MKSSTLRTFQTVHTWTGVAAGFFLFIAFYAGALTVFHDAIATWQHPPWRAAAAADTDPGDLARNFAAAHPTARRDFGVVLPPPGSAQAPYVYWPSADGARFVTANDLQTLHADLPSESLADFVYELHDSLGLPVVGLYLMGVVSVLYGLALVSGVLIHLPSLVRDLFALRPGRNLKRLWQDAHNVIGLLSLPFHIIFAVTGAVLCLFTVVLLALNTMAFDGRLSSQFANVVNTAPQRAAAGVAAPMQPLSALVARAREAALTNGASSFRPDYVHYMHYGDRHAVVEVRGLSQHTVGTYGTVALDGVSGRVLNVHVADAHNINGLVYSAIFALHFGSYGGMTVKVLYFLLGLGGAFLFYSGNLLWIESRRKRRHADQPARTRWMARATVGVCIGSCLGISAAFLAVALADGRGDTTALQQIAAYGAFALACLWAALREVPRATCELLWATALVTALAAVTDLLRNAHAWTQPWTPLHGVVFGVDLTGLLLAAGFAWLARASGRRALRGDANSVWALPAAANDQGNGSRS
ncbi:PepSY-associated TM helix domain-containing protein [Oleiagrimonas soli]|uniref:Putative iron-regulated membrane protein n=1 Tax=Oleiagrimonas soli TaxID=1543381 RepID=A0A099CUK9_9GAMM|nr:PepSY-associated TM helix domain-containing protein [Oleiagrimonas soli]KGI76695.1 hypothetical protein LF63_0114105 [Oleiagrimonas soli]MBB6185083.1 putative iron-regulated membrane protein [Oleiagrimonas soli]